MWATVESIRTDLLHVCRLSRKAPVSTAPILLMLALGLGLHIAVFAFYRTFFLAPAPGARAPERLAIVAACGSLGGGRLPISYFDYRGLAETNRTLSPIAAYLDVSVALSPRELPNNLVGEMVTPGCFEVLGVCLLLGHTLSSPPPARMKRTTSRKCS